MVIVNALDLCNTSFLFHDRQPEELRMSKNNNFDIQSACK